MTNGERVGLSFLMLALVGMTFILWAAANKRTDDLTTLVKTTATTATPPPTPTTSPLLSEEVQNLKKSVLEIQANRGLTGPEVRALVETLLPAETCAEPPCDASSSGMPPSGSTAPTTEQQRRRR